MALTSGSGSRMIDRLEAAGFVRRVPDARDRRRVLIEPVPAAVAKVGGLYSRLNERHLADLSELSEAELGALLGFLKRATESTEEEIREI